MAKAEQGAAAQGSDSEVVRVLRAARGLIEKGWTQGRMRLCDLGGTAVAWCSVAAIAEALSGTGLRYDDAAEPFRRANNIPAYKADAWNDAPERTQAEVLAAFDKAIALAEAAK